MIFYSSFEVNYLWLPLIGFIVGLLASGLGAGGGLFYLVSLVLFFNISPQIAVSTALAATLPISIVGSVGHFHYGHIHLKLGAVFAAAGILGAWLGAELTNLMTPSILKISFGIYAILLAGYMFFSRNNKKSNKQNQPSETKLDSGSIAKGSVFGLMSGVISGGFGTGGAAPVLAGLFALRIPVKLVIGTSLLVVLVNTIAGLAAHFVIGKIDLTLVLFLAGGAVLGAVAGPRILSGINTSRAEGSIRKWYALGLAIIGMIMIITG